MRLGLGALCLLLIGCESTKEDLKDRSPDSIYKKASGLLSGGEYEDAASEFKDIETLFPYSSRASDGQVMAAYCHFMISNYVDAVREIEVFLRYHPSHKLVPYAMYLKAMCGYMQVASIGRDSKMAIDAKLAFMELANKFPNSEYHQDCIKKIAILDDIIAAHEMAIGRYYQQRKNALAAIGRYMFVSGKMPHTRYAEEALYRIAECCDSLNLKEEVENACKNLESQYPNSSWNEKVKLLKKK